MTEELAPTEVPFYKGGPTGQPIEAIPSIDDRDLRVLVERLNYVQGICHSTEMIIGRWLDEDGSDARKSGKYVMGEKLMHIITSLGYANVGFITDRDDLTTPDYPMIACCLADALYLICDLCAANGWPLGDILKERIVANLKEPKELPTN